jgi:hypothetical protein
VPRDPIVRANDCVRFHRFHHPSNLTLIIAVEPLNQGRLHWGARDEKGLSVASDAGCYGRGRVAISDKGNAPAPQLQKVLCDHVAGAPVIDAYQVVAAAVWIRQKATVKQHHRDAGLLERRNNSLVDLIASRSSL